MIEKRGVCISLSNVYQFLALVLIIDNKRGFGVNVTVAFDSWALKETVSAAHNTFL